MAALVLDVDTGRDDALAIWLAIAWRLPLVGVVASYGNAELGKVVRNCVDVLALAGASHVPLLIGADRTSSGDAVHAAVVRPRHDETIGGFFGYELPNGPRPLPDLTLASAFPDGFRRLARDAGPVEYVVLGPSTSLARLHAALGDELPELITRITALGGKSDADWAATRTPDFNVGADPIAFRTLLRCGPPVRIVTLDTTSPMCLSLDEIEALVAVPGHPIAEHARRLMTNYCLHFPVDRRRPFCFHDPAVLCLFDDHDHFEPVRADVDVDGPERGRVRWGRGVDVQVHVPQPNGSRCLERMIAGLGFHRGEPERE